MSTTHGDTTAGDDLLRWASETGSGGWERLRDACAYVCEKYGLVRRPWALASELSALGHVDIDWSTREWSVAPPALNLVPGLGLWVVLTGSRPHYVDQRFEEATDDLGVYPQDVPQPPSPAVKYAKCATVEVAERVADRLGAQLVLDPGRSLVAAMRAVDEVPIEAAPAPRLEEARRFEPSTLTWDLARDERPGLYRIDLHGRPVHRRLDNDGQWWAIDLAAGQFLSLRGRQEPVVRWHRPRSAGAEASVLEVRSELSLPILAERAACVSSGFLPERAGPWRRYRNVPRVVAETIAERLLQDLWIVRDA